jgi:hypothetical protein
MDVGKLILDEIVGPAEAFFSVRNFASFGERVIPSQDFAFPGRKKKSVLFITIYIALRNFLYWKIICIENYLSLQKFACITKFLSLKKLFMLKK